MTWRWAVLLLAWPAAGWADALRLPPVVEREGRVRASYAIDPPRPGVLDWEWTDAAGRLVMRRQTSSDGAIRESAIELDLGRARADDNTLRVRFAGQAHQASFVARPPPGWPDYAVMLWQTPAPARFAGLRSVGITALKRFAPDPVVPAPGLRWYVENIATDFYAAYHRWTGTRPVTALFDDARALHRSDPGGTAAFLRTPSLSDPAALANVRQRLREVERAEAPHRPLFYNLGDETGIADLAAAWDFDLSPSSLDGMRDWLRARYGSLDALNRQWGATFANWADVMPELTTAAMRRPDRNWSAWADWKDWMDESFARALRTGTDAVHAGDAAALAGIEGAQVPGWGGYDYGRLATAVDVMEIYDSAANLDIARSLNPALVVLTTSFDTGPAENRRLWRDRLRGAGGLVLWDEKDDIVNPDGSPGPRGTATGPTWRALAGPEAAQFAAGEVRPDPVAVLYSQASFRTRWMLDHAAGGDAWTERDAEREGEDTAWRASLRDVQSALAHLALTPRWLSSPLVEGGALRDPGLRMLLLPHAIALSNAELTEIEAFRDRGGVVLADTRPGLFDGHSRRRDAPPTLATLAPWPRDQAGREVFARRLPPAPVTLRGEAEAYVRWTGDVAMVGLVPDAALDSDVPVDSPGAQRRMGTTPTILVLGTPGTVAMDGPARIRPGQDAKLALSVEGAAEHVVSVRAIDPADHSAEPELVHVVGRRTWRWRPIDSDPPGIWTIEAYDPLSGTTLRHTVELVP